VVVGAVGETLYKRLGMLSTLIDIHYLSPYRTDAALRCHVGLHRIEEILILQGHISYQYPNSGKSRQSTVVWSCCRYHNFD
jgi:hypothetical protein